MVPGYAAPDLAPVAELLERGYRLALLLQASSVGAAPAAPRDDFESFVLAAELVAVLDEARAGLLLAARLTVR